MSEYTSEIGWVYLSNGARAKVTQTGGGFSTAYLDGGGKVMIPVGMVNRKIPKYVMDF